MSTAPIDYAAILNGGAPPTGMTPGMMNYENIYHPDYREGDPGAETIQNRTTAAAWGNQQDQYNALQQNYYNQNQGRYQSAMDAAGGALGNTPGYTTDEMGNVLQTDRYNAGMTTQGQYASLNPTDAQTAAMKGDPNSLFNYYDPKVINDTLNSSTGNQRQYLSSAQTDLGNAYSDQRSGYDSAIDPTALSYDANGDFLNSVEGAYGSHSNAITSAANNPNLKLNLNPEDYLMGDKEFQDTLNQASESVQNQTAAQNQAYENAALASGNADPMSVAALKQQNAAQGDEARANAVTDAYLAARGQQTGRAMNYAQANLGANQGQAGLQVSSQENLLGQQLNEANNYQASTLGANQNLANMRMGATTNLANAGYSNAMYGGNTGIGMEQGIGQANVAGQQYLQNTGQGLSANVNNLNTTFGNQQYQNSLNNAMYQQQNTYNQNTALTDRQSAAYQAGANARVQGQNNFLNWSTGQTNANTQASLGYGAQRNQAASTSFGAMGQATNTASNWGLGLNQTTGVAGFANDFSKIAGGAAQATNAATGGAGF